MQPAEAVLKLLTVHIGASARAEPRGRAEVHIVDDEAVATGVCIQDVCLHNEFSISWRGLSQCTPKERSRPLDLTYMVESGVPAQDMGGVCNPQGQLDKYQVRTECHLTIQGWKIITQVGGSHT